MNNTNEPTESDLRKFNKGWITRTLSTVVTCGHKLDTENGPKNDCMDCWLSYWNNSAEMVQIWSNVIQNGGEKGLIADFGKKKVKWFHKFMMAVDQLRRQHDR